jgi:hypothetical protein
MRGSVSGEDLAAVGWDYESVCVRLPVLPKIKTSSSGKEGEGRRDRRWQRSGSG